MKALLLSTLLFILFPFVSNSQSGPGGVGNSSNNVLWLDASQIVGVGDSTAVSTWVDRSGNNNHSVQTNILNSPLLRNNQINGLPSVQFDGVNDYLNVNSNLTTGDITVFTVYHSSKISLGGLLTTEKHVLITENNRFTALYNDRYRISKGNGGYGITSMQTDGNSTSAPLFLSSNSSTINYSRNGIYSNPNSIIGRYSNLYLQGNISEILIYNEILNSAERKIVSNYLAAKYNLIAEQNLYSYKSSYGSGVKGIGQELDGNHLLAKGNDSLRLSNPSSMGNGDYLMVGHNNAGYSTTTSAGSRAIERWNQVWKADVTGTPGTVDLEFFLGGNGFAMDVNYILLLETVDGDFTNGGTSTHEFGRIYDPINNSIKFTNVNLVDGAHFTLAEKDAPATSMSDGNWDDAGIWSCECVPGIEDIVISQHDITIRANQSSLDLNILSGGSLIFSGSDTLFVHGDLNVEGAINAGTGTIAAVNSSTNQHFYNYSTSSVDFYNLYVNNAAGLIFGNGDWTVSNNLQVSSGGMDVSLADSVILISNSTSTAQILSSMANAFVGNFIIQRYIGPRAAGWSDLSSPVNNATVADLDDDLYLSGVNGNDGNVSYGGSIFYSVFKYDYVNDAHVAVTSTTETLAPAKGYEVWLADNSSSFFGQSIDVVGTPNNGTYHSIVDGGWNFVGNPYQSFIAYDSIQKSTWVPDNYYIWNTNTGNYDFFSGTGKPPIAPGQGFWINKISGGSKMLEFTENIKVSSNSSTFLREKKREVFTLRIYSSVVPYQHQLQVDFSTTSSNTLDEKDAFYLKSKLEEAPAITTHASDSEKELIYSSLNPLESSQQIPISIYAGLEGEYQIQAENLSSLKQYYNCVFLVDKFNNTSIDLSARPTYTFEANKGKSNHFELILSNSYQDCQSIVDKEGRQQLDSKFNLRKSNGFWYLDYNFIEKDSQVEVQLLNMTGQKVRETESFRASGSGSYQLQNLEGLNGLFLIQVKSQDTFLNKVISL